MNKPSYTPEEMQSVIEFLSDKDTISASYLQRHFNKPFLWASEILKELESQNVVGEFKGNQNRSVIK